MFVDRAGPRHPILVPFGAKLGHEHAGNRAKAPKDRTDDQKNDADDPQVGNAQSVAQDDQASRLRPNGSAPTGDDATRTTGT